MENPDEIMLNEDAQHTLYKNPIYLTFRNAGPSLTLIVPSAALFIVGIIGVALNAFIVYITAKSTNLRSGTANVLMALICGCEVLHQAGHSFMFVVVVSGINFVGLLTAELFLMPQLFGIATAMMAMLCAAFDRLLAVAFPFQHRKWTANSVNVYLLCHICMCAFFGAYNVYAVLSFGVQHPHIPTTGCISEIVSGPIGGSRFFIATTTLNIGCILCYAGIWVLIRHKKGVPKETNTRLLRSLLVILLVNIGGYMVNLIIYQVLGQMFVARGMDSVELWQLMFIPGVLLNITVAANAPILYTNSTEYRKAIRAELRVWAKFFGQKLHIAALVSASKPTNAAITIHVQPRPPTEYSMCIVRYNELFPHSNM